jgi:predicted CoA-binding protein
MNHDHYSDDYLAGLLSSVKNVAVVGASVKDDRPSHWICGFLLGKGYHVFPVNPAYEGQTLMGQKVYAHLDDIPEHIDMVDVFRPAQDFAGVVDEVLALSDRPAVIWAQLTVRDDTAAQKAEDAGLKVVMDRALAVEYALVRRAHHQGPAELDIA